VLPHQSPVCWCMWVPVHNPSHRPAVSSGTNHVDDVSPPGTQHAGSSRQIGTPWLPSRHQSQPLGLSSNDTVTQWTQVPRHYSKLETGNFVTHGRILTFLRIVLSDFRSNILIFQRDEDALDRDGMIVKRCGRIGRGMEVQWEQKVEGCGDDWWRQQCREKWKQKSRPKT